MMLLSVVVSTTIPIGSKNPKKDNQNNDDAKPLCFQQNVDVDTLARSSRTTRSHKNQRVSENLCLTAGRITSLPMVHQYFVLAKSDSYREKCWLSVSLIIPGSPSQRIWLWAEKKVFSQNILPHKEYQQPTLFG